MSDFITIIFCKKNFLSKKEIAISLTEAFSVSEMAICNESDFTLRDII